MEQASETPTPRPQWRKAVRIAGIAVAALLLLVFIVAFGINTGPGRALLARQVSGLELESGLRVQIGRIDGSLYSHFTVHDVRLQDLDGEFLRVPSAEVRWKPGALVRKHVVLDRVQVPSLVFSRIPRLNDVPEEPDQPLFPDIDITLGELTIGEIVIGPQVAGEQYVARARASGALADGRLSVDMDASADAGDRLVVKAAIAPEEDRLDLSAILAAPVGGLVSSLAGTREPLSLTLDGKGGWSQWNGTLLSRLGAAELAALEISGRNGSFDIAGKAAPALLLEEGAAAHFLASGLDLRSTFQLDLPLIATSVDIESPAFTVAARGNVNTENSRFEGFKVDARLLQPAEAMEGVSGRDVVLSALLNGPMNAPGIVYDLTAGSLGYGEIEVSRLRAKGEVAMSGAGEMTIPVSLSLASVSGVHEAVAGLLERLQLDGVVQVTPEQVSAEKVTFRSAHLSGRANVSSVLASGAYKADVAANLTRYAVPDFGIINAVVNAALASDPATGALSLNGDVRAEALQLDNESAREFLGGRPVLEASVRQLPDGRILVRKGTIQAPRFQFNVARGIYTPSGMIDLVAEGQSAAYGPFSISAAGRVPRPEIRATMGNPNLGVGLRDVQFAAIPAPGGYGIGLTGKSPQGDLRGQARLLLDNGPLAAEIAELRFADLRLSGRVQQTTEGPFAGTLALNGMGLNGTVRLGAEGAVQRADLDVQAQRSRPPVLPGLAIGEGRLQARMTLPESGPNLTGSLAARLVQYQDWRFEKVEGTATLADGRGKANLALAGRYRTPFEVTLAAQMEPERAQVDLNATLDRRRIRLAAPAVAEKTKTGWRLLPATLNMAGGRLTMEGETGDMTSLQANWTGLSLRFLDAIDPELGFSGSASGTFSFAQTADGRTPKADLRMVVSRLQRTGLSTVSPPLDLGLNAALTERQAAVRMLLRHEQAVVGSMQAKLALQPGDAWNWVDQVWTAPLSGGMRFSGPVGLLWAMSGLKGQELDGSLVIAADMNGTLSEPLLRGSVRMSDVHYENVDFGTRVQNLALEARFAGSRIRLVSLTGTTPGGGKLTASGFADLNQALNFPMNVKIELDHFRAARTDAMQAVVTGPITITRNREGRLIAGDIRINEARYQFTGMAAEEVPQLEVKRIGAAPPAETGAGAGSSLLDFNLKVRVRGDNRIFIQGMGLDSEWSTDVTVGGTLFNPQIVGKVEAVRGNYAFAGRRFDLNRGVLRLGGEFPPNPTLDIEAGATVNGVEALLLVAGQALKPQINFSSVPALPQDEILSRLLFGGSAAELSATEALQLGAALASLQGGGGGGLNPLGKIRQATNVDRLRIVGADETTGRGTSLAVGQYLTDDVYVEVSSDTQGNTLTQLQIELTRALSILSQVGQTGTSSLQLQYTKDY